jgi:hypothetical protein
MSSQSGWRRCVNCNALFYGGNAGILGRCPAKQSGPTTGLGHEAGPENYELLLTTGVGQGQTG